MALVHVRVGCPLCEPRRGRAHAIGRVEGRAEGHILCRDIEKRLGLPERDIAYINGNERRQTFYTINTLVCL